jgi:vacuolar-type H+-ATPase subunit C/Vma6
MSGTHPRAFHVVAARARGLGTHLISRHELDGLRGLPVATLARELSARLGEPAPVPADAAGIDGMARRAATRARERLARWPGGGACNDVFEADLDRRSLRALLRGAVQAAPASARLSGLLPTRCLPEAVLAELARQATPRLVVSHLTALGHPDASRLAPLVARAEPDLLRIDVELVRAFAARASEAVHHGDRSLRAFVQRRIDVGNGAMACALAGGPPELEPASCYVAGGVHLTRDAFVDVASQDRDHATERLARALRGSILERAVRDAGHLASRLETTARLAELAHQRACTRLDPLGSAPLLVFLLRLDLQTLDVCRIAWAAELGGFPVDVLDGQLVTPWS